MTLTVLGLSYWGVLVAELIGDKSIYTVASLSLRFRARAILSGMLFAYSGKMLIAVLAGHALAGVSTRITALLSGVVFFGSAFAIWRKNLQTDPPRIDPQSKARSVVPVATLFLTEWCDAGQLAAVALTAEFHSPMTTWIGGTLAMLTKGALAITLGISISHKFPQERLRVFAIASCCVLGFISFSSVYRY